MGTLGSTVQSKSPAKEHCLSLMLCSVEFIPRYIKTSGNATVDHLSKYLAVRLALEDMRKNGEASPINVEAASEKQYTIYIPTANSQFTVSDSLSPYRVPFYPAHTSSVVSEIPLLSPFTPHSFYRMHSLKPYLF